MKLIDISHTLNNETPVYPGDYETTLKKIRTIEKDYYCSYLLSSCLHTGTHVDVPMHLIEDSRVAADFALENFIGNGVLLDVRGENPIHMKAGYEERITEGSIVLLLTGFDQFYHTEGYFSKHTVVGEDLAEFLLARGIKMLGMDMPSPDFPPFIFHKALLREGIFVLENLTNLQRLLSANSFEVLAFPLKISAEASFVRAVCRID